MAPESIGIVGLGLLGAALSERLLRAGFQVVGFDLDPARRQLLIERGGESVPSVRDLPGGSQRILFSLPDTRVVESVLDEMAMALRPGLTIIDTTTGDPEDIARLGASLSAKGVHYLDATISGSSEQVRRGDVIVMVGGDQGVNASCADVFDSFARARCHIGPWGSGARMKLVVNLVLGLNRAALAEGLALARASGLDMDQTLHVLGASAAYSRVMDIKGRKMLDQDFTPQAKLAQHLKDVRLILAQAVRVNAKTPMSELHQTLLAQLETAGWGELDNSAVIKAFE